MSAAALALWLIQAVSGNEASTTPPETAVRAFVEAYNERDFAAFGRLLGADAAWYAVEGAQVTEEARGRPALLDWTRNYLTRTCPSCRSELLSIGSSGSFVTTVERASWVRGDGSPASQSSVAVYRVANGEILEVWYFPATPDHPAG